ncbi:hypothetical protein SF83666_b58490 (plasmid) [Sinorhizobium fredii CCBAU 83666]|nr:hypothetical protein SF83666_b58490 [Sinorhizobium fredii CCBAU 83666]
MKVEETVVKQGKYVPLDYVAVSIADDYFWRQLRHNVWRKWLSVHQNFVALL